MPPGDLSEGGGGLDICGYSGKATDMERVEARLRLNTTRCSGQPPTEDNPTPSCSSAEGERAVLMAGWGEPSPGPSHLCAWWPCPSPALGCWAAPALSTEGLAPPCGRTEDLDSETAIPIPTVQLLPAVEMGAFAGPDFGGTHLGWELS